MGFGGFAAAIPFPAYRGGAAADLA